MIVRTVWTNLTIQGITFVTSVLVARLLGPSGRGELALVLLYPQLVANIALLGVDRAVAVMGGRGSFDRPFALLVRLTLLLSAPAVVTGYVVLRWLIVDPHLATLATIYLAYVPAWYFYTLVVFLFNGSGHFEGFNRVRLVFYCVNLVLVFVILLASLTEPLDWVLFANLASVFGASTAAAWLLRGLKLPGREAEVAPDGSVRGVLGLASIFVLPVSLAHLSKSAFQIVLVNQLGVELLGLFVVFLSYGRLLWPVGNAIGAHLFRLGIAGEDRDVATIFRQSLLVYAICSLPLWLVADRLIPLIFGKEFAVDTAALGLIFVSCLFALTGNAMAEFLRGRRKVRADSWGWAIYLVVLGILGWELAPSLGVVGVALAMAVADSMRCGYLVHRVGHEAEQAFSEFWRLNRRDLLGLYRAGRGILLRFRAR